MRKLCISLACLALTGCGGSSNSTDDTDYSRLKLAEERIEPLQSPNNEAMFADYVRNGLRLRISALAGYEAPDFAEGAPVPVADSAEGRSQSGNFSDTNVHVQGVDEADRVKYDGEHLFIAASPRFNYYPSDSGLQLREGYEHGIRILATDPADASASEVGRIELSGSEFSLATLYLVSDSEGRTRDVAGISHKHVYGSGAWQWSPWGRGGNDSVQVRSYDVTHPASPEEAWTVELDGALAESRQIGNILYLVTRYSPVLEGLHLTPTSPAQRRANETLIANTDIEQLLPNYRVNGGSAQPLVTSANCFVPEGIDGNDGYADLVTLVAFDLDSRELVSSVCLNTVVSGIHMSTENLYLGASVGATNERNTGVHKFALNEGQISYRGTGAVPGEIGWNAASFRMDEHDGHLRIVTTTMTFDETLANTDPDTATLDLWIPPELDHNLTILREQPGSNRLQAVASLPNAERPNEIGKPGEDIFAVRFHGERAYIVTFERIDPLYVLDLSVPEDPRIAGELEVPGFSTYLHPIGDDYLLGIGQDANDMGWPLGVKVELYDVRDLDRDPEVLGTYLIGGQGTSSPALYDLRAINFLRTSDDQLRFTLPIDVSADYRWQHSALYLYEVNGLSDGVASLADAGQLVTESNNSNQDYFWHGSNGHGARSRLHDDAVYFIYGNEVWSSFWESPESLKGPQ